MADFLPNRFMLYHLFQTAISKDITLHVSANNNAMVIIDLQRIYGAKNTNKHTILKIDFISKVWIQA